MGDTLSQRLEVRVGYFRYLRRQIVASAEATKAQRGSCEFFSFGGTLILIRIVKIPSEGL
jgi:hypothetical protein